MTNTNVVPRRSGRSGFTLVETVLAGCILLLLFLSLFTTLLFCRLSAANLKWRMAAEAFAFDVAWDVFNRKTSWFDDNVTADQSDWMVVPEARSNVFAADPDRPAIYNLTILREPESGDTPGYWRISVDVIWPRRGNQWGRLPQALVVDRYRVDRNLFRTGL